MYSFDQQKNDLIAFFIQKHISVSTNVGIYVFSKKVDLEEFVFP